MLISHEEAERRLASGKNLMNVLRRDANVDVHPIPKIVHTPPIQDDGIRVVAGTEAHFAPASKVAASLGITEQQVRSAKNSKDIDIRTRIERSVEQVQELALLRTIETLQMLTSEDISGEKPRDRAAIAASLSRVYGNVRGDASRRDSAVQFVVFAPQIKNETHYDILEAGVA